MIRNRKLLNLIVLLATPFSFSSLPARRNYSLPLKQLFTTKSAEEQNTIASALEKEQLKEELASFSELTLANNSQKLGNHQIIFPCPHCYQEINDSHFSQGAKSFNHLKIKIKEMIEDHFSQEEDKYQQK